MYVAHIIFLLESADLRSVEDKTYRKSTICSLTLRFFLKIEKTDVKLLA